MSRLAALAVLLFPVASLAQTITVFTDATNTQPVNIGKAACDENRLFVFRWNLNVTPLAGDTVKIFITKDTATCTGTSDPTTAPTPPLIQPTSVQASGQASVTAQQLLLDLPGGCSSLALHRVLLRAQDLEHNARRQHPHDRQSSGELRAGSA